MVKFHFEKKDSKYQVIYEEPGTVLINDNRYYTPSGPGGLVESLDSVKNVKVFYCAYDTTIPANVFVEGNVFLCSVVFSTANSQKTTIKNAYLNTTRVDVAAKISNSSLEKSMCRTSVIKNSVIVDSNIRNSNITFATAKSCTLFDVVSERSQLFSTNAERTSIRDSFLMNFEIELGTVNFVNSVFTSKRFLTSPNILCRLDFVECGARYAFKTLGTEDWCYVPAVWKENISFEEILPEDILYFDSFPEREQRKLNLEKESCYVKYLCSKDIDKITILSTKFISSLSNFASCNLTVTKWVDWFVVYEFFLVECLLDVLSSCDNKHKSDSVFCSEKEKIGENIARKLTLDIKKGNLYGCVCFIDTKTMDYLERIVGLDRTIFSSFVEVVN